MMGSRGEAPAPLQLLHVLAELLAIAKDPNPPATPNPVVTALREGVKLLQAPDLAERLAEILSAAQALNRRADELDAREAAIAAKEDKIRAALSGIGAL